MFSIEINQIDKISDELRVKTRIETIDAKQSNTVLVNSENFLTLPAIQSHSNQFSTD